jgi:uncharacterized membrane protein
MPAARKDNIDLVRGLVMVFMAVDHFRDYVAPLADPVELATVTPLLFVLRVLAHFCAPVFAFLMGVSVWLGSERKPAAVLTRQLLLRGALLVALEFTLVDWAWNYYPPWPRKFFQVMAALGFGLMALALVSRLGRRWTLGVGVAIVALHNLADGVSFAPGTAAHVLWSLLHQRNVLALGAGWELRTSYPILPITGVALLGYGLGEWVARRDRRLVPLGLGALALFLVLRLVVGYGDPHPYEGGLMSLFNVTKYPFSLQFVLMTLGPALVVLAPWNRPLQPFTTLGRVPLFYYVTHIAAIHATVLLLAWLAGYPAASFQLSRQFGAVPRGFTLPIWSLVPLALCIVALLYPLCRRYEQLRRRTRWLAYF